MGESSKHEESPKNRGQELNTNRQICKSCISNRVLVKVTFEALKCHEIKCF